MKNSEIHRDSRHVLFALAAGGATVAAGGVSLLAANMLGLSSYEDAVRSIWRHSDRSDLSRPDVLRELVRYGTLAANSHNTQPWQFHLAENRILVLPDIGRRCPAVDPDNHHLYASLGCAIENMVHAAKAFALRATPSYDSALGGIDVPLDSGPRERTTLFQAIPLRQSTRSNYDGRPVPAEHLRLLEAAGNGIGVRMMLFLEPQQREEILAYLVSGNSAQMDDAAFIAELKSWVRFSYHEALATGDGLFTKTTGNPVVPSSVGRLLFSSFLSKEAENKKYVNQLRSSAGVAVFVSEKSDPAHWVEAGRCYQRFALQATALGLLHSFINQPVEVPAVRGQFATFLGVGGQRPDLVVRFGYGHASPRSLRRPVEEVVVS